MAGVFLPVGYAMTLTASATKAGNYCLVGSPDTYAAISAGNSSIIGPFNEPKQYDVNDLTITLSPSGTFTKVDADAVDLKQPLYDTVTAVTANGAVTPAPGLHVITKAGVCAITLAAPSTDQNGMTVNIVSTTAYAHTVTATGLLRNGGASSPYDLATFSAYIGAGISLIAHGGYWYIHAARNITFS
jgi:hypothetical protein